MSDEGPHAEHTPDTPEPEQGPCAVTQLARQMSVQGLSGLVDMQHRDPALIGVAIGDAVAVGDEGSRVALLASMNEVALRLDMAAEVLELLYRLTKADREVAHAYATDALERLSGRQTIDYLRFFTVTADAQGLLPDKILKDLTAKADAAPYALPDMLDDRRRWHEHSVHLNQLSWRIAQAVGDVPEGATCVEGDVDEQLTRLVAERDGMRRALAQIAAAD